MYNVHTQVHIYYVCNCNLEISTAPIKAKSQEPAYSQALIQNKINRQGRVRQADSQMAIVSGEWS